MFLTLYHPTKVILDTCIKINRIKDKSQTNWKRMLVRYVSSCQREGGLFTLRIEKKITKERFDRLDNIKLLFVKIIKQQTQTRENV